MSKRLRKNFELLKILKKAKPNQRKILLEAAENDLIYCLCECIDNVLRGNVKLTAAKKKELAKHATVLRNIVDRRTKVHKKRALLVQKGGIHVDFHLLSFKSHEAWHTYYVTGDCVRQY